MVVVFELHLSNDRVKADGDLRQMGIPASGQARQNNHCIAIDASGRRLAGRC